MSLDQQPTALASYSGDELAGGSLSHHARFIRCWSLTGSEQRVTCLEMRRALLCIAVATFGCKNLDAKPSPPFEILVRVESDPGRPLGGAVVVVNARERGTTAADGRARLSFNGNEGDAFDLWVRCPEGYMSPTKPVPASLRRIADPTKLPEYDVSCPPSQRSVVVAIRAENGPNLPVVYLNKEIARTDASGAAHVYLPSKPGDSFELMIGTTEKGNEKLRPQNPTAPFVVRSQDDLFIFDQKFTREREVKYVPKVAKPLHF